MTKRLIWAAIGFGYAVVYGFWTMLVTGGGHGNFLWLFLFLSAYFFGGIFPAMGFILADLRPLWAKASGLAISIASIGITGFHLCFLGSEGTEDIIESWNRSPIGFVVLSLIHILPLTAFIGLIVHSFYREKDLDLS